MSNTRIIEIPATMQTGKGKNHAIRKLRVAAYCRVSTEEEEQQSSFETQKLYYSTQCFLLRIRLSCSHPAVKALLADWQIHRTAFENGRITSSDYLEWMLQWPPTLSAPDD